MPIQGRHVVVEGSYEKEASRREHKEDCQDRAWACCRGKLYEKEANSREHKEDCQYSASMLTREATRRKLREHALKKTVHR